MRTLAIDPGARRVGLAMSDASGSLANPFEVLTVSSPSVAIEKILRIIEAEGVERLLIGIPLNMDGSISPGAREALEFGQTLARRASRPVVFVDERLSTFGAEQSLIERKRGGEKITRKKKKSQLDALAACMILQAFLDGKLPALDPQAIR